MIQKNSQLTLLVSNPRLPGKGLDLHTQSGDNLKWNPLTELLRRWKQRRESTVEQTPAERLEIEARVRVALYPKKIIR
jgi:hypothetical protein